MGAGSAGPHGLFALFILELAEQYPHNALTFQEVDVILTNLVVSI
jgi:hypothetical protein